MRQVLLDLESGRTFRGILVAAAALGITPAEVVRLVAIGWLIVLVDPLKALEAAHPA